MSDLTKNLAAFYPCRKGLREPELNGNMVEVISG